MTFRDLAARMDVAVMRHVATDTATIDGVTVSGAFTDAYTDALGMQATTPAFSCRALDAGASVINAALVYDGVTYTVRVREPDGAGWVRLILEEQ